MDLELEEYYFGRKLYGNDFGPGELTEWYEDEREAYATLVATHYDGHDYAWHALNQRHGFSKLPPDREFTNALGLGSASGDEFQPIANRVKAITVVDPSEAFDTERVRGVPLRRVKPQMSGDLPFEDHTFDLVLCFGVLHHVANVSHVVKELARCTIPGGSQSFASRFHRWAIGEPSEQASRSVSAAFRTGCSSRSSWMPASR